MIRLFAEYLFLLLLFGSGLSRLYAQQKPWSERMAATAMTLWADSMSLKPGKPATWIYEQGLLMKAIEQVWHRTGEGKYFAYIKKHVDSFVQEDGSIRTYDLEEYNIDHVTPGRAVLIMYRETGEDKYRKAAFYVRQQLETHPRTSEGGFWHKKIYPYQMWLDGLYMGEPFYAEFARLFNQPDAFNDITRQFVLMEKHSRDPKTGLLYHGWDESRQQQWADPKTGRSPNFWGRSVGWYAMALVDALDYFPAKHPGRDSLTAILRRLAPAVARFQDPASGVWFQVLDKGKEKGNYLEASASCMLVYALAKGVRNGYLPPSYREAARKGYQGILKEFIEVDPSGTVNLNKVCKVAGLGGKPYRDGSYEYYLSEPQETNDPKGVGPFILASVEMEIGADQGRGKGKKVAVDTYFNHEWQTDAEGRKKRFHYTWEDQTLNGYSWWGRMFEQYGATLSSLQSAPTKENLKDVDVFIIVDPDTPKETEKPQYITPADVRQVSDWVRAGGVLVVMANDSGNAELKHLSQLTSAFGIGLNQDSRNRVKGRQFEMGKLVIPANHPVFKDARQIYIKELCTMNLTAPAQALLTEGKDVIMAYAKVGKGTVFVVGDPWLYNEYTDGKKLPAEYENYQAGKNLTAWLLDQTRKKANLP